MEGTLQEGAVAEENSPEDCFRRRGRDRRGSAGAITVKYKELNKISETY